MKNGKEKDKEMYLHMVIPEVASGDMDDSIDNSADSTESNDSTESIATDSNKANKNKGKKVYYEVGCKVLELNKIYK